MMQKTGLGKPTISKLTSDSSVLVMKIWLMKGFKNGKMNGVNANSNFNSAIN
jgi:hypothetical protein